MVQVYKEMSLTLFIFRRDFRTHDNTALSKCRGNVLPVFIYNESQITSKNAYLNHNSISFMIGALEDLQKYLRKKKGDIHYFYSKVIGDTDVLEAIYKETPFQSIAFNTDITPFAVKRDTIIKNWAHRKGIKAISEYDYTLIHPENIKNKQGLPYKVYTPFKKEAYRLLGKEIKLSTTSCRFIKHKKYPVSQTFYKPRKITLLPTRQKALEITHSKSFSRYPQERDSPYGQKTTRLGAYLKFGLVSIREVYTCFVKQYGMSTLVDQLLWREFYYHLTHHFPFILEGKPFKQKYTGLRWKTPSGPLWKAFITAKTGYPIVDAGITQLLTEGYVHNRVRMYIASFLTKNLQIDWRAGEKFFAQHLYDYDPANNNQGWQWTASLGVDTRPYRVFNIWTQTKVYDPEAKYIKRYVADMREIPVKDVLSWDTSCKKYPGVHVKPIVDYSTTVKAWRAWFTKKNMSM